MEINLDKLSVLNLFEIIVVEEHGFGFNEFDLDFFCDEFTNFVLEWWIYVSFALKKIENKFGKEEEWKLVGGKRKIQF